jgi:CheY-like chemotaxis protein
MDTLVPQGSNLTVDAREPVGAERDVALYFRDEAAELEGKRRESSSSSGGWWSRLMGWLAPGGEESHDESPKPERQGRKVLLVDDEADGAEALVGMFRKSGYDAEAVGSAEQAMASIRAGRPGVVLVDVMMSGRDGVELLREIRADPGMAKLPVLMLTANCRRMLESFTCGAQDYLIKPVEWGRVRESVERQLGRGEVQ